MTLWNVEVTAELVAQGVEIQHRIVAAGFVSDDVVEGSYCVAGVDE